MLETDVVVVGGGISGLATAYALKKAGLSVHLMEAGPRVGGAIQTRHIDGYTLELGPNTLPSTGQEIAALIRELGLEPKVSSAKAKNRYIYHQGKLQPVPASLMSFIRSPLLSKDAKLYLLGEPFRDNQQYRDHEVSVAKFARHRLGPEVLETLLGPFLTGIYAGNPEVMSFNATLPKLHQWIAKEGSLVAGAVSSLFNKRKNQTGPKEPYALWSFEGGLDALPQALHRALGDSVVQVNRRVEGIEWNEREGGYRVYHALVDVEHTPPRETVTTQCVVWTTPTPETARMVNPHSSAAANALSSIHYAPMAVVHLGIQRTRISHALDGFGMLVPRTEGLPLLGSIWSSSLFKGVAPEDHCLFTCFFGGALHPEMVEWNDDRLAQTALHNLNRVFQSPTPGLQLDFQHVHRWHQAIPQYHLGHKEFIQKAKTALQEELPGMYLSGNYLHGVSLNDCVKQAHRTAQEVQLYLKSKQGTAATMA